MDWFDALLKRATEAIAPRYFALPIDGRDYPAYRERVYCYELYHQLRKLWPDGCPYSLCGEVDKRKHPYFGTNDPKPDFIVHVPGQHDNYAVIEVKRPEARAGDIRNDIEKLSMFRRSPAHYNRGIYLIYGENPTQVQERLLECVGDPARLEGLELWVHPEVQVSAQRVSLS